MYAAVLEDNIEKLKELVRSEGLAEDKHSPKSGYYLLCKALEKKHIEVALFLLREVGVDVKNNFDLRLTANDKPLNLSKQIPIHLAIFIERLDIVEELLKKGAHVDSCNSREQTPLHLATGRRNKEIVNLLLNNGANVNAKDIDGNTALSISCRSSKWSENEDEKLALILLNNQADIDAQNNRGYTPLHYAITSGNRSLVELLIERKANVNLYTKRNLSPLHVAARGRDEHIVLLLLNNNAFIDAKDYKGSTPLHGAVGNNNLVITEILLNRGANVNIRDDNNRSPLHAAFYNDDESIDEKIASLLIDHNADLEVSEIESGYRPLHHAIEYGTLKHIDLLLSKGADVNSRTINNSSPLHLAISRKDWRTVKKLLDNGADVNITDNNKKTPLCLAVEKHSITVVQDILLYNPDSLIPSLHTSVKMGLDEIVECLLNHGANPDGVHDGCTPLHIAIDNYRYGIVKSLIKFKCDVTAKSKGKSPICFAVERRHEGIVELILNIGVNLEDELELLHTAVKLNSFEVCRLLIGLRGMDVNACDRYNRRPLHYANFAEMTALLLRNGADINARDENGQTALHLAVGKELLYGYAFLELLEYDIDVDVQDNNGNTPLHLAVLEARCDTVELLLSIGCDINIANNQGLTPIDCAISETHTQPKLDLCDLFGGEYPSHVDNEYSPHERIANHIRNHLTRLQAAELYMSEKNFLEIKSKILDSNPVSGYSAYYQACRRELKKVRCRKLDNNISLYNALIKCNVPKLRPDLIEALKSINYKEFHIYGELMKTNLKRCEQRSKLISLGVQSFCTINRGKKLPIEVIEKIICELSNKDLKNLIS